MSEIEDQQWAAERRSRIRAVLTETVVNRQAESTNDEYERAILDSLLDLETGGGGWLDSDEVRNLLSEIRAAVDPNERMSTTIVLAPLLHLLDGAFSELLVEFRDDGWNITGSWDTLLLYRDLLVALAEHCREDEQLAAVVAQSARLNLRAHLALLLLQEFDFLSFHQVVSEIIALRGSEEAEHAAMVSPAVVTTLVLYVRLHLLTGNLAHAETAIAVAQRVPSGFLRIEILEPHEDHVSAIEQVRREVSIAGGTEDRRFESWLTLFGDLVQSLGSSPSRWYFEEHIERLLHFVTTDVPIHHAPLDPLNRSNIHAMVQGLRHLLLTGREYLQETDIDRLRLTCDIAEIWRLRTGGWSIEQLPAVLAAVRAPERPDGSPPAVFNLLCGATVLLQLDAILELPEVAETSLADEALAKVGETIRFMESILDETGLPEPEELLVARAQLAIRSEDAADCHKVAELARQWLTMPDHRVSVGIFDPWRPSTNRVLADLFCSIGDDPSAVTALRAERLDSLRRMQLGYFSFARDTLNRRDALHNHFEGSAERSAALLSIAEMQRSSLRGPAQQVSLTSAKGQFDDLVSRWEARRWEAAEAITQHPDPTRQWDLDLANGVAAVEVYRTQRRLVFHSQDGDHHHTQSTECSNDRWKSLQQRDPSALAWLGERIGECLHSIDLSSISSLQLAIDPELIDVGLGDLPLPGGNTIDTLVPWALSPVPGRSRILGDSGPASFVWAGVLGDPTRSEPELGLDELDHADSELLAAAKVVVDRTGSDRSAQRVDVSEDPAGLIEAWRASAIVHVISHGELEGDTPLRARWVFSSTSSLAVGEVVLNPSGHRPLILLSNCFGANAGQSDWLGMASGLLLAGAGAVIAFHGPVPDAFSAMAMPDALNRIVNEQASASAAGRGIRSIAKALGLSDTATCLVLGDPEWRFRMRGDS